MKSLGVSWMVGLLFLISGWWIAAHFASAKTIPPPTEVFISLKNELGRHAANAKVSGSQAAGGILLAALIAGGIIVCIGLFPSAEAMFYPYIVMLKASPAIAFAPVFVALVGIGPFCKVLVSAMISFFPLVIGGIDGLKTTPEKLLNMANGYGSGRWPLLRAVKWGYAWSGFLSGLKTAAPLSVVGAIVGEFVAGGSPTGLGTFIMVSNTAGLSVQVFAAAVVSTTLGVVFFSIAALLKEWADRRLHLVSS